VCQLVCALENFSQNNPKLALLRIAGHFPAPGRYEVRLCDECGLCREACPAEAIREVDGALRVDEGLCTNCLACVEACPKGVMTAHRLLPVPRKCVHCGACAELCPTGAIYDADRFSESEAWRVTRAAAGHKAVGGDGDE
jgi:Fe-S-cluster-containing hydrogenase component 2